MEYKKSKYNFFFESMAGEDLAFNAVSGGFAKIEKGKKELVTRILKNPNENLISKTEKEVFTSLTKGQFIIPSMRSELNILKTRFWSSKFGKPKILGLTLAPTMSCNFDCIYCYENKNMRNSFKKMGKNEIEKFIKFLKNRVRNGLRALSITWYGGEPLLAFDRIRDINNRIKELLKEEKVRYKGSLITNGYLLSEGKFKFLSEANVNYIQITLDGPPEVHNKYRPLRGGQPTFRKILDNLKKLNKFNKTLKNKFEIGIRVNLSKDNLEAPKKLSELLEDEEMKDEIFIHPGRILGDKITNKSGYMCIDRIDFTKKIIDFLKYTLKKGWRIRVPKTLVKGTFCSAYNTNSSFTIDPRLNLFKCWTYVGMEEHRVGFINEEGEIELNENNLKWISYDPFDRDECKNCKYLPICMGGCIDKIMVGKDYGELKCTPLRHNLEEKLKVYFEANKLNKKS